MEIAKEDIEKFNSWCECGITNYPNFPVGRVDKLSPHIIALFLECHKGVEYNKALEYEINNLYLDAIQKD